MPTDKYPNFMTMMKERIHDQETPILDKINWSEMKNEKTSNEEIMKEIQNLKKEIQTLNFFVSLTDEERRIFNQIKIGEIKCLI